MKASLLLNCPFESKKCWGLNTSGVSHCSLSNSTEESIALIGVPWGDTEEQKCQHSKHLPTLKKKKDLFLSDCTLGIKYSPSIVSLEAILGNPAGTMFPILWHSWITASVYGMLGLSAIVGWRDCPITLSTSSWILAVWRFETFLLFF